MIQDIRDFGAAKPGLIDLLFNMASLPGFDRAEAVAHLAEVRRLGVGYLLSINQGVALPNHTAMSGLVRLAGGYRLASRHRLWLRVSHLEELCRIG